MSLFIRIWLSFLITLGAILLLLYTAIQWSFSNGLIRYINQREAATYQMLSQNIATFYVLSEEPSLLEQNSFYWRQLLALSESGETLTETRLNDWKIQHLFEPDKPPRRKHHNNYSRGNPSDREHKPPRRPPPNDHLPISLLSKDMRPIYGPFKQDFSVLPVNVNGAIIANIAWPSSRIPESTYDVAFAESQKHAFLMLASLALVFGAILALFFSRRFTNPLDDIANTTQKLAHGDYDARTTTINGHDEITTLGNNINTLATTLKQAETARRDWLASTAHELRTPLSIIKGEFEAILDGIRPADANTLTSIEEEIAHLQKLIEDLYELTNADVGAIRYRLAPHNLSSTVVHVCQKHAPMLLNKGITLTENVTDKHVIVHADEMRIQQLLENLLSNSEKYTDQPGNIVVLLEARADSAILSIEDSAPGVPDDALKLLFEKLFRVESSRNRQRGGSGLGLAVAKKIVLAHGGTIVAEHSHLGGLKLVIKMPLLKE